MTTSNTIRWQTLENRQMPIFAVPSAELEPKLSVECWQIYETDQGIQHLVGYCIEHAEGRVSSAITELDPEQRTLVTVSGREYELFGPPGVSEDADYAWQQWQEFNGILHSNDITPSIWEQFEHPKNSQR